MFDSNVRWPDNTKVALTLEIENLNSWEEFSFESSTKRPELKFLGITLDFGNELFKCDHDGRHSNPNKMRGRYCMIVLFDIIKLHFFERC